LKKEVAGEEHARAQSVNGVGQIKLPLHLERGEAHVDAIEIGHDVEQKKKRHQTPGQPANDHRFHRLHWFLFARLRAALFRWFSIRAWFELPVKANLLRISAAISSENG
jgi:hypothetical protein